MEEPSPTKPADENQQPPGQQQQSAQQPQEAESPSKPQEPESEYEDIPEDEYEILVKEMEEKKASDEANQVQGRQNLDYTVSRKRKKQLKVEQELPAQQELKQHQKFGYEVEPEVLDWIKERLQKKLLMFDETKHWTKPFEEAVRKVLLLDGTNKLFVWIQNDKINFKETYQESEKDIALICNFSPNYVSSVDKEQKVLIQLIGKNHLKTLVNFMNNTFIPNIIEERSWPDNVRKQFLAQMHKFMTSITEICYQLEGYTELYIPKEDLSGSDGQDKDLIQRLESTIIQWNRQIKEIISNTDSHQQNQNQGPLDEIHYWRKRRQNLKHIDQQLENPELKQIVRFLEKMGSNDAKGFGDLAANIKSKSEEANNNLLFLESIFSSCQVLESAEPKNIPDLLPGILMRVRMIWEHSKYYNSSERISGLLHKISNQIIKRCKAQINVSDMLDGDVEKCIRDLNDAIECGKRWRQIYDRYAEIINKKSERKWDFSTNSIFASVEAFVQRCSELIQICQGQLQFALKGKDTQIPKFSGAKASEIVGILLQIKGAFRKLIDKFRASKKQKILDVKASNWHDEYNSFKAGVKQLDVMYQNVIDYSFKQVTTIQQGVDMLEAFDYLAKRDSIKICVKKKSIEVMNLFINQIEMAKQQLEQKKMMSFPLHHGKYSGSAILIRSILFRLEKFKQKVEKLYFVDEQIKAPAFEKYTMTIKQMESMIKDQKLAQWKEDNKIYEEAANLNKSIEAVTLLCRPDEQNEDYKLPELLKPKPKHIECNFDRKLLRLLTEVSAWKVLIPLNIRVPNEADEFVMSNKQNLRVLRQYAMVVVRDYNQIIDFMDDNERNLFAEHLAATDKVIQPGISRFKWSSRSNIQSFLGRSCRITCQDLFGKLKSFKANTQKIDNKCAEIASNLFLNIDKKRSYLISEFEEEQEIHQKKIKQKLTKILKEIQNILCESYEPFIYGHRQTQLYWFNYVKQIDKKIQDSLKKGIKNSLVEFYMVIGDQDKKIQPTPIFTVSAILQKQDPPKLAYKPSTGELLDSISEIISSVNDVVSGFVKIQNKMYEVYQKKRSQILERMEKEKNPMKKTMEEEEIKVSETISYYKISDDIDIQKYSMKIINNLNKVCKEVTKDSTEDKWTNTMLFWENSRKEKFIRTIIDKHWMDIANLRDNIENTNNLSEQIQEIKSSHPIGCIILDDSSFKQTLSEIVILWQNSFMSHLQQRCVDELKELHDMFKTTEEKLLPDPQDLRQLNDTIKLWEEKTKTLDEVEAKLQPLKDKFAELDAHSIQLKDEQNRLRATLIEAWDHYNEMLLEMQKRNQRVRSNFHSEATKSLEQFLKQASDLKINFQQNSPMQATYTNENAFSILNDYNDLVQGLRGRWNQMIYGFEMFEISYTSPADLDNVDKEIKNLESIWGLKEQWDQEYIKNIKDIVFRDINCEELEEYADDYIFKLGQLSKEAHIKRWGIVMALKASIDNFKTVLPLIDSLRKPFMRNRHWQELQNNFDFDPESASFTFDEIYVQKNFLGYAETINNTCEIARQEYKIESALSKIKEEYQSLDVQTQPYKKTYKIKATQAIFAALEEHMGTLSNQKTGLFYENFKDEIETWETNLQKISETLQMLIQVQRQWIYLESIFASQQDQDRQLIGDINKFQILNGRISTHMDRINGNKNIIKALLVQNFFNDLDDISKRLDESQKVLFSLLETKRGAFSRFYFLANDDLFQMLGNSKNPDKVNKHIKKCFQGIKKLNIVQTGGGTGKRNEALSFEVRDIFSPQEEQVKLTNIVPIQNGVQVWLKNTERQMRQSLKKYLAETLAGYTKKKDSKLIQDWVEGHQGQLLITASQIHWTADCEAILRNIVNSDKPDKDKGKMWKSLKEQKAYLLNELTKQVRKSKNEIHRLKLIALITIEVHTRDITDNLSKKCFSPNSFQWKKQLRFRANIAGELANCYVDQTNTSFEYGYEYQGNNGRLVVTALTDRCYMTLTTAMHLKKGGAPQGPAGTGKTETVKDLGKGLAKFVLVFNCSEGLDYKSLGRMFSGLMQSGGWGCFDEFNRIELEVLSVVAQQMLAILDALKKLEHHKGPDAFSFMFEGAQIPANEQCAIFITMNPGYAGRSQLPDNLKSLFRPISMMVPDSKNICQIMLSSEGFKFGKMISNKIVVLYELMSQQLSKQDHYDWGLRAIKSVLTCAGAIRRSTNIESPLDKVDKKDKQLIKQLEQQEADQETLIVMKAINDMNMPKFVGQDIPLFLSLFNDLFPGIVMEEKPNTLLVDALQAQIKAAGLIVKEEQIKKMVQLYDSKNTRHGNMLVGISQSGKSTCWKILKSAMNTLNKTEPKLFPAVRHEVLNPKSVDLKELFGYVDGNLEWHEGVLSSMMGRLCKQESPAQRWMILDGPVDTLWIESMNTVLDDNKVLTLLNGDRISLPPQVGLVFEVEDLSVASPATVSRAGMIFVNLNDLGWKPYIQSWILKIKDETIQEFLNELIEKWFTRMLGKKLAMKEQFKEHIPTLQISIIITFTKLMQAYLQSDAKAVDFNIQNKPDNYWSTLEKWFIFCFIWSFGGPLEENGRKIFDSMLREIESVFPGNYSIYDYYINHDKGEWQSWEEKVNSMNWKPPANAIYHSLVVPTVDSQRNKYVLQTCVAYKIHTMSVGVTGTGKTVLINQILGELDQNSWKVNNIIFSSQTSSLKTQDMIEGKMTRRTKTKMVPDGKKMVIYVDDMNMPKKDTYGSQPPLELLRQWMDYGGWFDRVQNDIFKKIEDVQFISSMGPPGGGRNQISRRIQSKFAMINFTFPSESQVRRIFHSILSHKFTTQDFDDQIKQTSEFLSLATLNVYNAVAEQFLPTPKKSHYVFNLRDIGKVIQGIYIFDKFYCDSKLTIYRLWVHESLRVFHDRLISIEDRMKIKKIISDQLQQVLQTNMKQCTDNDENDAIFVDFIDQSQGRQIYIEVPMKQREQMKKMIEEKLQEFNEKFKAAAMNITLFQQAISYVCKINRVIKFQKGHGMLVGEGGAGRHSLTKLATFIAKYTLCTVSVSKSFKLKDFRERIKEWSMEVAFKDVPATFMFSDNQISEQSFVQDINTILTIGQIPNLFGKEDLGTIKEKMKKVVARILKAQSQGGKEPKDIKDEVLLNEFYTRIQNNFHLVFLMSKTGDNLRNYGRMYPGLINNTTIVWFMPWPKEALVQVAENSLKDFDFDDETRKNISTFFGNAHTKVIDLSEKMFKELKRSYYVTPTNYIELVKGYCQLLKMKRQEIGNEIAKLGGGLDKLNEAEKNSQQLQKNMAVFQNQLDKKNKDCQELLITIDKEKRESKDKQNELAEREQQVNEESQNVERLKAIAEEDLKKAEPALIAAEQGLANLTKDKLSVVKSYTTPPGGVDVVLNAVMILLNKEASWAVAKKELADTSFLQRLQTLDKGRVPSHTLKKIEKLTQDPKMQISRIDTISEAAGGLWRWVLAVEGFAKAFKDIEPKKITVNRLSEKLKKSKQELDELRAEFSVVKQKIDNLNRDLDKATSDKEMYKQQTEELQIKLERADKLINGLASTRQGWKDRKQKLQQNYGYIVGDSLITAAFQAYAGPFPSQYRQSLMAKQLIGKVKHLKISFSADYNFPEFLVKPVDFIKWGLKGLPDDQFSKQNGVLVRKGRMFPLLIDPQLQGNRWIREMQKENKDKFVILDPQTDNYIKTIEVSVANGNTVLLQNLDEQIDSSLEPLLNKTIKKVADRYMLYFGDKEIRYNENFRFFMTTKLPNPTYKPQVTTKVILVNFTVKQKGLEEQLTSVVIGKMQVQLQNNKNELIKNKSDNEQKMKVLDDGILKILSSTKNNLIDDENIIVVLQQSKQTEEKVRHQIESSVTQMKKILAARENYRKLAKVASKLFFIINDFSLIESMYQFSLDAYIGLYSKTIKQYIQKPGLNDSLNEKLDAIAEKLKTGIYRYACRGLFEKDKLLLGFMMTIRLKEKQIDPEEYNFLLRGGTAIIDRKNQPLNPNTDWIQPSNWNAICDLEKLPNFPNIIGAFVHNAKEWKKWYMTATPEKEPLPGQWNEKCDSLRKLIITKIIRRDRVLPAVINFIVDKNGNETFVHPPNFSLESVFADSNKNTPIVFVLSPGVDPYAQLEVFSKTKDIELVPVSLGQGQAKKAKEKVNQGAKNGSWLYLANCHLSLGFLKDLQKMLESFEMNKNDVHNNFRLWLSTNPHPKFPISILQRCVKITTQPPRGVKANMLRLASNLPKQLGPRVSAPNRTAYRRILFSLCWYHSLIIERKRFKTLGWNITYDFNDSDWDTADKILQQYIDETEQVKIPAASMGDQPTVTKMPPWDAIRYLVSEVTYGGRVTDDWDRRLLNVYATEYFNQQVIVEEKHRLGNPNSTDYVIPDEQPPKQRNHETQSRYYSKKIQQWASTEKPDVFGQHINAEISSQIADTNILLDSLQSLQATQSLGGDDSAEARVRQMISELLNQLDQPIDEDDAYEKVKPQDQNPLKIVLMQEIARYNRLLKFVRKNLNDLDRGIQGLVLISEDLQKVMFSLFENKVPDKWKFAYYSLKPLSLWMADLNKRIDQLRSWVAKGQPNIFWISGFSFPTGFTTALRQQASRKYNIPIDEFNWQYSFERDPGSITSPAKEGAYVSGLFLEGAKWDIDKNCITEPEPMKLYYRMPIIQFKPVHSLIKQKGKKGLNLYTCPTYMYPIRTGVRERPSFMFEVYLPIKPGINPTTSSDQDFWTKRGTALLMSLAGEEV